MMKLFLMGFFLVAMVSQQKCNKEKMEGSVTASTCFKGRLEVKGLCSNYTIKLLEGKLDPSTIESSWTDPQTGNTHSNVFALGSPCSFPAALKEGDTFYFTLDTPVQNCAVCQAYYPKPAKSLGIKVLDKPCP